ncbi:MAG: MFS transporter [Alphaproteobacteria bacterium]|nr:MFS transporter [Alphaproteobacteria bacterium]
MSPTSEPVAAPSPYLMRHPSFVLFWAARFAATAAYQMQAVAIGWQVYDLTHSAFNLGLVGLVQFVPVVLLALVVGHVADRYDRRLVIRICQVIEGAAAAVLALGSAGHWLTTEAIYAVVFVIGSARAFELPTMHALVPGLVPQSLFTRAVAGSATANQIAIISGPALGGVLYLAGPAVVYGTCSALFLIASLFVTLIHLERVPTEARKLSLATLLAGFAFIRSRPAILGCITLDLFAVLLGGATALLPVYARDILATGPWGLGLLRAAPAIGALSAFLYLTRHPLERRIGRVMFASVGMFGLATLVFGISTSLPLSLAALAVLGASDSVSVVIRLSLVQTETPDEMRGRVSAVNSMFIGTSNTLGEFESGVTAAWFGTVPAVLLGGIGTILVALICMRVFPSLARIESFKTMS